jgi:hypothetical protein
MVDLTIAPPASARSGRMTMSEQENLPDHRIMTWVLIIWASVCVVSSVIGILISEIVLA